MGNVVRAITLLPLIVRLVEFIYGAKKGQIKKDAALKVFFGLANMFFPGLDTPEICQVIGDLIDQLVSLLTETGVLPAHSIA